MMSLCVRQLLNPQKLLIIALVTLALAGVWAWRSLDSLISMPIL
jgi:hypothetical protein